MNEMRRSKKDSIDFFFQIFERMPDIRRMEVVHYYLGGSETYWDGTWGDEFGLSL